MSTSSSNTLTQTSQELLKRLTETISKYPVATTATTALLLALSWTLYDFSEWKAFGTGGTPPTWAGYVKMTKIRLGRLLSSDDLHSPHSLSTTGPAYLAPGSLPSRARAKPRIMARTMPQRQHPESITPAARTRLHKLMSTLAKAHPTLLECKPSKTEGFTTDAIYAVPTLETLNPVAKKSRILGCEIAHAHGSDNSLHVWLADRDARTVIEAGWGMRFPLSFVESGWTMVFAPRDEAEVEVVEGIVRAGVAWVCGVEI